MENKMCKAVIFSGPSGSGKTTIAKNILKNNLGISFSVSACTRLKRPYEIHGEDYYFLSTEEFKIRIAQGAFMEWEEVYTGSYYGTFKTEIASIWNRGQAVLLDIDVQGALKLKSSLKENALAIYVKAPSLQILKERLKKRETEPEQNITLRTNKALQEDGFACKFDSILTNDDLQRSLVEAQGLLDNFLKR